MVDCLVHVLGSSVDAAPVRVVCSYLVIMTEFELKLDSLLEAFEPPIALFLLQCRNAQEFMDRFFRVLGFHLLGIIVFVFDVHVSALLNIIVILVFEIVAED